MTTLARKVSVFKRCCCGGVKSGKFGNGGCGLDICVQRWCERRTAGWLAYMDRQAGRRRSDQATGGGMTRHKLKAVESIMIRAMRQSASGLLSNPLRALEARYAARIREENSEKVLLDVTWNRRHRRRLRRRHRCMRPFRQQRRQPPLPCRQRAGKQGSHRGEPPERAAHSSQRCRLQLPPQRHSPRRWVAQWCALCHLRLAHRRSPHQQGGQGCESRYGWAGARPTCRRHQRAAPAATRPAQCGRTRRPRCSSRASPREPVGVGAQRPSAALPCGDSELRHRPRCAHHCPRQRAASSS